jgi:hypothetical protein
MYGYYGLFCMCCTRYAYRFVCIPMSFKGRNHVQIQSTCQILVLFLDQKLRPFQLAHFVFLLVDSYIQVCRFNSTNIVSVNSIIHFLVNNIRLAALASVLLEITWNFGLGTTRTVCILFLFVCDLCFWRALEYIQTYGIYRSDRHFQHQSIKPPPPGQPFLHVRSKLHSQLPRNILQWTVGVLHPTSILHLASGIWTTLDL